MKKIFTYLFLFYFLSTFSQKTKSVYPSFKNKSFKDLLINDDWRILIKTEGFLNFDKTKDIAIVLESKDSIFEKRIENQPRKNIGRILLVLINDKVLIQNNTFLARGDEGGMSPYIEPELEINNNQLKIYYQYLRSNISYFFECKRKNLKLTKAKSNYVQSATGNYEFLKYDFINKLLHIETGNISEDGKIKNKIPIKLKNGLKKLSELKEMYQWEVLKDRYL